MKSALVLVGLTLLVACDKSAKEPEPRPIEPKAAVESKSQPSSALAEGPFRFVAPERLVAIGDVHGDLTATRAALRLAGAIDDSDQWTGGKLVVVQTGDQLDRGDEEREIVDLMRDLHVQAAKVGGAVHSLNGNHEIMNVQGDFRYVTPAGMSKFGAVSEKSPLARSVPAAMRARAEAFLPGGEYARILAKRPVIIVVGDSVFAHGGVLSEHVEYGIAKLNAEVSAWMQGTNPATPHLIRAENGPVWTRIYGAETSQATCSEAARTLEALKAKRIVVGHTVQKSGISSICDGAVWRIDVGLAAYYGDRPAQVLEITQTNVRPLTAER